MCSTCNVNQEPGFHKENQMIQCPTCYGRGLIAHRDGSDTMYVTHSELLHFISSYHFFSNIRISEPPMNTQNLISFELKMILIEN